MLVGCVSFDCHPGSPFSHIGDACCYLVYVLFLQHHSLSLSLSLSLSAEGHSCSDNNTRSLSLRRRSLARSACSDVPVGLSCSAPLATRIMRITLNYSPQKAGAAAGRPAVRARRRKGPKSTSTAPSSALLPRS
jgi:hypothetical protein